ncbi:hypothetical protein FB446DRAFT_324261 [Lentinula raphanica]|nr:hypothetical protein FB446DRAFT_324261 [Lentinula raphanica]
MCCLERCDEQNCLFFILSFVSMNTDKLVFNVISPFFLSLVGTVSTGMSYKQIATKVGKPEQHVIDVCTGTVKPTAAEFNALATVLGITDAPPHDSAHATV